MSRARIEAERGTCSRLAVGVVIATPEYGLVISEGWNGAPAGQLHCDHSCRCASIALEFNSHDFDCASLQPCSVATHAEARAIGRAAACGMSTRGTILYTTVSPCEACARLIIEAGIREVVYAELYRDSAGLAVLTAAGITVRHLRS